MHSLERDPDLVREEALLDGAAVLREAGDGREEPAVPEVALHFGEEVLVQFGVSSLQPLLFRKKHASPF